MEKFNIQFCLNYKYDLRDIKCVATDFENSEYSYHYCPSFLVLSKDEKTEISPSEFSKKTVEEIEKEEYIFKARNFNIKNLTKGSYGVLKEKYKTTRFYIIKVIEVNDYCYFDELKDKNIAEYVNSHINKKNYTATYIKFYTDKNWEITEDMLVNEDIKNLIEKVKKRQGTLSQIDPIMTIEF